MKELYVDTRELLARSGSTETKPIKTGCVGLWWAFWVISAYVATVVLKVSFREIETLDDAISLTHIEIVSWVLDIVSTFLTFVIIRNYSRVEPLLESLPAATERTE